VYKPTVFGNEIQAGPLFIGPRASISAEFNRHEFRNTDRIAIERKESFE
jgi:hypothetical protein